MSDSLHRPEWDDLPKVVQSQILTLCVFVLILGLLVGFVIGLGLA